MNIPAENRLHGLDLLRATAIILVLLFHYRVYYGIPATLDVVGFKQITSFGWSGVDLFFVLSGYLIGNKLLADHDQINGARIWRFYVNRAFRILPAYFVALALYFSIETVQEGRALQPLWKFLTFTQNLPVDLRANTFSHAWSLSVEEHYYLLLPIILFFVFSNPRIARRGVYILLGVIILGALVRYVTWAELVEPQFGRRRLGAALKYLYYPTYARLDGLAVGFAIAALFRFRPNIRDRLTSHGNLIGLLGLGVLAAGYVLFGGNILSQEFSSLLTTLIGFPLISLGYGCLVVSALSVNSILYRAKSAPVALIATYSFSIYLIHKMTNHMINNQLPASVDLTDTQTFLVCLVAAVAGGAVLHYTIERPFLALRARLNNEAKQKLAETP